MGRGKDFRGPSKRGFDDDTFSFRDMSETRGKRPGAGFREPAPAEGPVVDGVVKWFNSQKGFGFVELGDGSGDAFLHIAVLQAAGREAVLPGAKLRVQAGQGAKGRQVTRVLEVDESGASPAPRREPARGQGRFERASPDSSAAVEMTGTVKWFNADKGFGFVSVESGGKDVFVHVSILDRAGLTGLADGQRVSMRVIETQKGREALSIAPAE